LLYRWRQAVLDCNIVLQTLRMKDSNDHSQDPNVVEHELCSEKKCATCFENRGCMYEQYFAASTFKLVTLLLKTQVKAQAQAIHR